MKIKQTDDYVQTRTDAKSPLDETDVTHKITSIFKDASDVLDELSDVKVRRLVLLLLPGVDPLALVHQAASAAAQNYAGKAVPLHLDSALHATRSRVLESAEESVSQTVGDGHTSVLENPAESRADSPVTVTPAMPGHSIETVRRLLEQGRLDLKATACTFYVRDSLWKDEFRLLAWPGVRFPETMHGFLNPQTTREIVIAGEDESFSEYAVTDPSRRNTSFVVPETIRAEIRRLFGDFVAREGVISSARLAWRSRDSVEAVLFVNYARRTAFDEGLKQRMRELLEGLVAYLPDVSKELQLKDAPTVQQMISILKPAQELPGIGLNEQRSLDDYFGSILDAAMDAAGLSPETGLGTIHLYQEDAQLLSLAAYRGNAKWIEWAQFQSVSQGVGVISWVALRGRPIIIHDLESSAFKKIHLSIKDDVRSELAVPMLVAGKLFGVLNLESTKPGSFSNRHVRAIAYAINSAALATRLFREATNRHQLIWLMKSLLECFREAAKRSQAAQFAVPSLAELVGRWLKADRCHILYCRSTRTRRFHDAGATDPGFDSKKERPRREGWSEYIRRTNRFIWISNIRTYEEYDLFFWDPHARVWRKEVPPLGCVRKRLHDPVIDRRVASELGIPILVKNRCIGVAWVEFDRPGLLPPQGDQMSVALGFAEGAGLIIQWVNFERAEVRRRSGEKSPEDLKRVRFKEAEICGGSGEQFREHTERQLVQLAADFCVYQKHHLYAAEAIEEATPICVRNLHAEFGNKRMNI